MSTASIGRGFSDPVMETQAAFRQILWAMSRPGQIVRLTATAEMPERLPAAGGIALLSLTDHETPVWLPPERQTVWGKWLAFHTGARSATSAKEAAFAVVMADTADLSAFSTGDERYPDRSTTVIVLCPALEGGPSVLLSGPGIEDVARIAPQGLGRAFWDGCQVNHALFPCGVDVLFVAGDMLLALPRSTAIALPEVR